MVAEGSIKLFYRLNGDNVPAVLQRYLASGGTSGGGAPVPIYLGVAEARMMRMEGLFRAPGDVIEDLFGNRVVVAGVLPPTDSVLDEMHFAGPELVLVP